MEEAEKEKVKGFIQEFVSLRPSTKKAAASKAAAETPVKVTKGSTTEAGSLDSVGKKISLIHTCTS